MRPQIARSLFLAMAEDRTAFLYSGAFHDDHTARLIALGEAAMEETGGRSSARGRLAFIMVEAYQNILRHRAPLPPEVERGEGRSLFWLTCRAGEQHVVAWNPINKASVPTLRAVLEGLRGLDAGELKRKFLTVLQREQDGQRKGAGLGLIEMARRSGSELGFELRALGEAHEMFILDVRMGVERAEQSPFAAARELHDTVVREDLLLMHTGERPTAVQEALLRMVEEDVDERKDKSTLRGRTYLSACGSLDCRARTGARRFFALVREGQHYGMAVGCVLEPAVAQEFEKYITRLRTLDRSEIDRRYRNALLKRGGPGDDADTLDLARMSVEPLEVANFPLDGDPGMFTVVRAVI